MDVRRSPRQISIKCFYKESSSSEEERRHVKVGVSLDILFLDKGVFPAALASASTLLISAIHLAITSAVKLPTVRLACVDPPQSLCPLCRLVSFFCLLSFFLSFQKAVKRLGSPRTLASESTEMPKRSRKVDREKAMVGGSSKPKSSDTAKSTRPTSTKGKATAGKPTDTVKAKSINIPLSECSAEFKKFVVTELVQSGKARVVRCKKPVKKGKK